MRFKFPAFNRKGIGSIIRFISRPQSLISREQLIYKIWGTDTDIVPGNVDNYISFLRKRLKELGSICEIKTIYGSGYRLETKNAE